MKKLILIVLVTFSCILIKAQSADFGKIPLSIVMPDNVEGMDVSQLSKLETKITQIVSAGGLAASGYNNNFVIYPKLAIYDTKVVESGMQDITVLTCELTLFIKQVDNNIIFSTINKSLKGNGKSKSIAITNAISKINVNDVEYVSFIETGKKKIIQYYESTCQDIINNSDGLIKRQDYEQALGLLLSIPKEVGCYKKAIDKSIEAYKAYQNQKCIVQLQNAKTELAGNNYSSALNILSHIDPSTNCNKEAQALIQKIEPKVDAAEREALKIQMKIYDDAVQLEKQRIQAVKDIAVAYYNRTQPTYNYLYIIK